ncbi:MAG: VOC family protein [Oscillospiraceae bacterium]|jgi:lactoylglutathione lyase|nr:VOC family protein [Oscillospiraceae bacterium]
MLDAIRKITLYVHDPEAALRFWTEQCHFVKRADHRMGPVRWLEVAPSDASPTSFVLYDKALMQQQNATVCVGHPSVILSTDNAERTYEQMKADDVAVGSLQQMPYGTMFTFQDPEGNSYLVRQEP